MPNIGRKRKPRMKPTPAGDAIQYANAEKAAQERQTAKDARLIARAVRERWPFAPGSTAASVKTLEEARDQSKRWNTKIRAVTALGTLMAQNQTDDLNAEKMARLDALKPTEIVATADLSEERVIQEAIDRGLVERLPVRLRERARKQLEAT